MFPAISRFSTVLPFFFSASRVRATLGVRGLRSAYPGSSCFQQIQKRALSTVSLDVARRKVTAAASPLVGCKHIIWAQHEGNDNSPPDSVEWPLNVSIANNWGNIYFQRSILPLFPEEEKEQCQGGNLQNHFIQWLAGKDKIDLLHRIFQKRAPVFLNCVDFVYLCLHLNLPDLITRRKIAEYYEEEILASHQGKSAQSDSSPPPIYYGFDMERSIAMEKAKPGDLVVISDSGQTAHVCLYHENQQVVGLWNIKPDIDEGDLEVGFERCFHPATIPLGDFSQMCFRGFGRPLMPSAIPLEDILKKAQEGHRER